MKKRPLVQLSEKIVEPLQALASSQRIAILLVVSAGEACVCHLEAQLGFRQSYISQHLMALRQAGLLDSRREGKYIFYRLAKPEILELIQNAARMANVALPKLETVSPEMQCACPNCAPVLIPIPTFKVKTT
jgi:ArsR family transcriptional regulator